MTDKNIDQLRGHTYDGIEEFDNPLPNWWLFILYASIVFAVGYWLVFHSLKIADLPRVQYEKSMIEAAEAQLARMTESGLNDESLQLMATLPAQVEQGRGIFDKYCVACHLEQGQGSIGPNLTDRYWIHGGRPMQIYDTVTNGVLEKGMAAWGRQLGPSRVASVTAYVLTLRNTEVPGKGPEGDFVPDEVAATPSEGDLPPDE